ncbi:hypothetical protein QR685DRAFT_575949 [Neurospora intermedia]|uniref:Uncharacterized protein n=1 Tax=Neurospora intermedia TaxID=5142 RepID=A0ABR3CZP2_NEUIN
MPITNEDITIRFEAASASCSFTFDKGHLALPPAQRTFGIELGDAHVIRNVRYVMLCYAVYSPSAEARKELEERKLDFLPFPEQKQAIQDDVEFLRGTKLVKDEIPISGWVYEVETGKTVRVV